MFRLDCLVYFTYQVHYFMNFNQKWPGLLLYFYLSIYDYQVLQLYFYLSQARLSTHMNFNQKWPGLLLYFYLS